jgi:predicted RNase H-like HicB family nuclease
MMTSVTKLSAEKYTFRVGWSEEDQAHVARCLEFPSLAAHGTTAAKALREIEDVVAVAIGWMQEEGEPIPEPLGLRKFRGNLTLRVPGELHRQLAIESAEQGVSINQYILSKIS